jgi:HAD superfamily hydrolase (TIGR01484 family)
MQPLSNLATSHIIGILTDVDDTLTWDGQLDSATYQAMEDLSSAGFKIVPVTGRSSGWGHMMMNTWPVDAVVAESGGTYFFRNGSGHVVMKPHSDEPEVANKRRELMALCNIILLDEPRLKFALDNAFRIVDVAIDYCESVERVPHEIVEHTIERIRAQGFNAKASSIHINAWHGHFDKSPTAQQVLKELFPNASSTDHWVFIGDAPNDASMFAAFRNSVAVANIKPYLDSHAASFTQLPNYLCQMSYGEGFQELAEHLLRRQSS